MYQSRASIAASGSNGTNGADAFACGLRLSLTSGTDITTTDVTAAGTLYVTPAASGRVTTYESGVWTTRITSEVSLALAAAVVSGSIYDVFLNWSGSAYVVSLGAAWTNATTRSAALARQDGIYVLGSDHSKLHLGTIKATGGNGTTGGTTEDSQAKRFVCNRYNPVPRLLFRTDGTDTWTAPNTTVWRDANGSSANIVEYVATDGGIFVRAEATNLVDTSNGICSAGIGIDSSTTNSAQVYGHNGNSITQGHARYRGYPGLGYHAIHWLEWSGTGHFYGDAGNPTAYSLGLTAEIAM